MKRLPLFNEFKPINEGIFKYEGSDEAMEEWPERLSDWIISELGAHFSHEPVLAADGHWHKNGQNILNNLITWCEDNMKELYSESKVYMSDVFVYQGKGTKLMFLVSESGDDYDVVLFFPKKDKSKVDRLIDTASKMPIAED